LELRDIRRDIRVSERKIAAKHGVSHEWLKKFRHKMWDKEYTARLTEPQAQETISAEQFVENFFNFALRPGVTFSDLDVQKAGKILLQLRTEFFGMPQNESEYYRGLCDAVAHHLGVAATANNEWVH
jgi:hypothetical protein